MTVADSTDAEPEITGSTRQATGAPTPEPLVGSDARRSDFELFYRAQYAPMVRLALSLCGKEQLAEEHTQEAFLAAHRSWTAVSAYDRPDLWVRRVVINRCLSGLRRSRTERRLVDRLGSSARRFHEMTPPIPDADLWRAVRSLPRRQAQAVALRFVGDLSFPDIGHVLGCSASTARTHVNRGIAALERSRANAREEKDDER
ncbi:MAG: sigma-70 family RNA polymerase sigma factor [Actinobacteria bacterium]|nr:sigma-70 family RNA polymerase sigma factor [Actinomycetota bacterium]